MQVLKSEQEDGVATLTITVGDDDHQFEVWGDGDIAKVEYEETLSWRGQIRVSEPDDDIWQELMLSDEMTEFLDQHDLDGVQRARPQEK